MSFYQSDQVVRRGHARANELQEPLMVFDPARGAHVRRESVSVNNSDEGQTVTNPIHSQNHATPFREDNGGPTPYSFSIQSNAPPPKTQGCFRCKLATFLILILFISWSTYDFLHGARDDWAPQTVGWVTINGTEFMDDCRPQILVGFNTDNIKEAVVVMTQWSSYIGKTEGQMLIRRAMQEAAAAGLTVIRTWAHTTNPDFPLQVSPGRYKEEVFKALDTVVDEARKAGLRIILTFVDNWKYYGGVDEFVDWSPTVTPRKKEYPPVNIQGDNTPADFDEVRKDYETARHALFFTDENCKKMYKNHVKTIMERKSSINGMVYKDDPAIFGWSLINEPRCETWKVANCATYLQLWLEDMAKFVKSIDNRHLLTIGEEGFFSTDSPRAQANPAAWGAQMGQNFIANHLIPEIDFATVHVWPDNWNNYTYEFFRDWIEAHIEETERVLQKPLVLMEFGKKMFTKDRKREITETRDPVYDMAYRVFLETYNRNTILKGILFWKLGVEIYENSGVGEYGVKFSDSTFNIIKENGRKLAAVNSKRVPNSDLSPACKNDCWMADSPQYGVFNRCTNRPQICQALSGRLENSSLRSVPSEGLYTTEFGCCQPEVGAFKKGCSWMVTKTEPLLPGDAAVKAE